LARRGVVVDTASHISPVAGLNFTVGSLLEIHHAAGFFGIANDASRNHVGILLRPRREAAQAGNIGQDYYSLPD
jgi:hypothetical protein